MAIFTTIVFLLQQTLWQFVEQFVLEQLPNEVNCHGHPKIITLLFEWAFTAPYVVRIYKAENVQIAS
jgi:hypothetical protein